MAEHPPGRFWPVGGWSLWALLLGACSGGSRGRASPPWTSLKSYAVFPKLSLGHRPLTLGMSDLGVLQPMGGILGIPIPCHSLPYVWWKRGRLHAVRRLPAALAVHPEAETHSMQENCRREKGHSGVHVSVGRFQ